MMCNNRSSGGGSANNQQNSMTDKPTTDKYIEDKYQKIIGNGRGVASELDSAETPEEVRKIESKMQTVLNNAGLDKQGKIAYEEAIKRRVDDALIRTAPISNKNEMINFFKEYADVDISPHIETGKHFGKNFGRLRDKIYIRSDELTDAQQKRITEAVKKKNISVSFTPGFNWVSYEFQKKKSK